MEKIDSLLLLYSQKINSNQLLINKILEVINNETNLNLTIKNITIKDSLIKLNIKSKEKLEIILNKSKILSKFRELTIKITDLK